MAEKEKKYVEVTRDRCYQISLVYGATIGKVRTNNIHIIQALFEWFQPYLKIGGRYQNTRMHLSDDLMKYREKLTKAADPDIEAKCAKRKDEYDAQLRDLIKETVQLPQLISREEFTALVSQEPKIELSSEDIYTLFDYNPEDVQQGTEDIPLAKD